MNVAVLDDSSVASAIACSIASATTGSARPAGLRRRVTRRSTSPASPSACHRCRRCLTYEAETRLPGRRQLAGLRLLPRRQAGEAPGRTAASAASLAVHPAPAHTRPRRCAAPTTAPPPPSPQADPPVRSAARHCTVRPWRRPARAGPPPANRSPSPPSPRRPHQPAAPRAPETAITTCGTPSTRTRSPITSCRRSAPAILTLTHPSAPASPGLAASPTGLATRCPRHIR